MNNFFAICARHRYRLQARLVEIDIVAVVLVTYQLDIVGVNYVSAVAAHQRCANERILYGLYFVAQHKAAEAVLVVIEYVHIVALGLDVVDVCELHGKLQSSCVVAEVDKVWCFLNIHRIAFCFDTVGIVGRVGLNHLLGYVEHPA